LIELFEKYVDWRILSHFLRCPTSSFHVKELGRILKVSPGSVSTAVKGLEYDGILIKEKKGLAHLYKLNLEHPVTTAVKKAYGLVRVLQLRPAERFLEADENLISLALVGSYAEGSYDEKSDIDFLVITPSRKNFADLGRKFEAEFGAGVGITVFKLSQWRQLARRGDALYNKIVGSNVLLYGGGLG